MKTNVMIRIDADAVQSAKALDLNISRICEEALTQAVEEEARPFEITESMQIILRAGIAYHVRSEGLRLGLVFVIANESGENVVLDRINYDVFIKRDVNDKDVQHFKGNVLERRTISKGMQEVFPESLEPSPDLVQILKETTASDHYVKGLKWVIFADLFVDSKKRILRGKFEQILDEKGVWPRPRYINVL